MTSGASFEIVGPAEPATPVILSVPHGGRDYPPALLDALRVPAGALLALEDRHVDSLALAARQAETTLIARRARAWIDLNRGQDDRDPRVDEGAQATALPLRSAKVRSGLGLVPRRAAGNAELWRRRFTADEIESRIAEDHRPYHHRLAAALGAAHARFGVAILVDLHSMPPLTPGVGGGRPARIVIGDLFGRTAPARFVARAEAEAAAGGLAVAINSPYAGGHILARHARPDGDVHALQVEIDRSLYLDGGLREPGAGFESTALLVGRILRALADEALAGGLPLAAE